MGRKWLKKYGLVGALFLVWELASQTGLVNPLFIPPLSKVLLTIWELTLNGELIKHTTTSLLRAIGGFVLSVVIALPLGFLLGGWFHRLQIALEPLVELFSQANPFVLFHIILLFLGIGEATKLTIIAWMCIWPILLNTIAGIQTVDPNIVKSARSFGLGPVKLFYRIILPAAAPKIFTGLRLSAGYAFFMLIAAEMMGASSGLGWLVLSSQENYHITRIFAAAFIIAILGLIIDALMHYLERRLVSWQQTSEGELEVIY